MEPPFVVKKKNKKSSTGPHKKWKSGKSKSTTPMVLVEGGLDKNGDVVHTAMETIWGHIEDEYHHTLDRVQQGLMEL